MRYFDRYAMARPAVFDTEAFFRANEKLRRYLMEADLRQLRQRRPPFETPLFKHPEVKQALIELFGTVCAYCESDMASFEYFDIEHHRPKLNAADQKGRTDYTCYVWLAYDWENLYPICRTCNSAKRNKFFVAGPRGQIGASVHELRELEQALLIDPCHHDIAEHLSFLPSGLAAGKDEIGRATIDVLTLNREALVRRRQSQLRLALNMLMAKPAPSLETTCKRPGWSSSVLASPEGNRLAYAGATTLALLEIAEKSMPGLADIADFLGRWARFSGSEKDRFRSQAAALLPDSDPEIAPAATPAAIAVAASTAKASGGSRILRLEQTPTAERCINRLTIRNFKALASIDLVLPSLADNAELAPCMLILGENATGKSSVLEALALALLGTREVEALDRLVAAEVIGPAEYVRRPNLDDWDIVADEALSVEVRFLGMEDAVSISGHPADAKFTGTGNPSKVLLGYGPRRYFPNQMTRRFRAPAQRARSLFDPMTTIANPIGWLRDLSAKDAGKFDAAVRALRIVLMLEDDALIAAEGDRIMIDTAQGRTPLTKLSVGYKSVIAMAIDIIRELFTYYDNLENACAVVLVDEIETHLHPRWKMRIVGLLRRAFPKVQFIMTTHDPLCLRGMYQGEVFVLRRSLEDNSIETLTDLPNVQGMRAEQILTSEFFGLGSTDPSTDAKVERYQYLTSRPALNENEREERLRLAGEIENQMMVGATIEQQTEAEAARQADLDAPITLNTVKDGDRKAMIAAALAKLQAQ